MKQNTKKRFAIDAEVRILNPGVNGVVTQGDEKPTVLGEYWHTIKTDAGDQREPGCNLELVPRPAGGSLGMKVCLLSAKIEGFRNELDEHAQLWAQSLSQPIPEYPVRNNDKLGQQCNRLARQLGTLKPYLKRLGIPTIMGNDFLGHWDAFDSAVSNDVAPRKGQSLRAVVPQLQQALGQLDLMDPNAEFQLQLERAVQSTPQHVTNIYNLQGAQSRVNVQSDDRSTNVSYLSEQQLFSQVRDALQKDLTGGAELGDILKRLGELEDAREPGSRLSKYQAFINSAAAHMTVIAPFIPALTQMLK